MGDSARWYLKVGRRAGAEAVIKRADPQGDAQASDLGLCGGRNRCRSGDVTPFRRIRVPTAIDHQVHHALSVTSIDRVIFSTDYSFRHPTQDEIDSFLGHFGSDEDRQKFSFANAAGLYGLDIVGPPELTVGPATTTRRSTAPSTEQP
jgi:hypothetical protein